MLQRFLENHILANLIFLLVLIMGSIAYLQMPRQQDPTVNLNWIEIRTVFPGASAVDVEEKVTEVLEEAVEKVSDIKFITSTSRPDISTILIRFNDLDGMTFDKRVNDLRREIQRSEDELPTDTETPRIIEITSANAYPSAMVLAVGVADDEHLRKQAQRVEEDLERFQAVERVDAIGARDPELQVLFEPARLVGLGVSPATLADTVSGFFRDVAAGSVDFGDQEWLIRLTGTDNDPRYLAELPILSIQGEVPLRSVAQVVRGREDPQQLVRYEGQHPAVMLAVYKKADANVLNLVDDINRYIETYNKRSQASTGVQLLLLDDQTAVTRKALSIMENNALFGLGFVLLMSWIFLGSRIALLTAIGIPFSLAGTFWFLYLIGQTLNVIVLLGIVISLGMLVDDAVVVVEAIYYRLQRGMDTVRACVEALREVFAPVAASVLTTIAAFLPLMLLPGVLGEFMRVAPLVVAVALLISLIEAAWMLPSHIIAFGVNLHHRSRWQVWRERGTWWLRNRYVRVITRSLRWPKLTFALLILPLVGALYALSIGLVRVEFFATDTARLFYVNVEMPAGTRLEKTLTTTVAVERALRTHLQPEELRSTAAYAGIRYTDREPLFGDYFGQVLVSLKPQTSAGRSVGEIIAGMRNSVRQVPGPDNISFLQVVTGAPPTAKPISIKVRGENLQTVRQAADRIIEILQGIPAVNDITDDDIAGRMELSVRLNADAIIRAGLNPAILIRDIRLLTDGEVVASMQDGGEKLEVRVRAFPGALQNMENFLENTIGLPDGRSISLGQLLDHEIVRGRGNIRHYNLRRAITVEAELNKKVMDTVAVNQQIQTQWAKQFAGDFPNIDLNFTGELDDIQESTDAIAILFLFGLGLIYMILSTQFKSYIQPIMVLVTVPLAFTGVIFGLLISGHPLSVYTLYGVVALAGIAVNSAIVLVSAANERLHRGMSVVHASIYAARRRVVPILITSLTTIAGLFSLAIGLGGKSLMWGPIASAIVCGLGISTLLTLFMTPFLYNIVVRKKPLEIMEFPLPRSLNESTGSKLGRFLALFRVGLLTGTSRTEQYEAVNAIAARPDLRAFYMDGKRLLMEKEYERAIQLYERAIEEAPENGIFYLCATQALLQYMQTQSDWDGEHLVQVKRYLARAAKLVPGDKRIPLFQKACARFEHLNEIISSRGETLTPTHR